MFFIGIFGIETKDTPICDLKPMMCKHCRQTEKFKLYKHYQVFHFFFIPLWKWDFKYYVVCDACQTIAQIPTEKGKQLEVGEAIELTLWDQDIIYAPIETKRRCQACHEVSDATYVYCPHCGEKL